MSDWWLKILGFDPSRIPDDAQTAFMWTRPPQSWGVFVMIALLGAVIYLVMYLYRREIDTCPRPVKLMLGAIRVAVVLLLALVFIGPALAISQRRTVQPYVVVLVDDSQSMSLKDRYTDDRAAAPLAAALGKSVEDIRAEMPERMDVVRRIVEKDDGRFLAELRKLGNLRILSFSSGGKPLETTAARPGAEDDETDQTQSSESPEMAWPDVKPTAQGTQHAKAIREALKSLSGNPLAAIVLVGDGQDTAKEDDPLLAADAAAAQKVPIITVGVGDPSKPQNLEVADVFADDQVWQGDPFEIQATIQSEGLEQTTIDVELVEQQLSDQGRQTGQGKVLQRKTITLAADSGKESLTFKHTPSRTGQYVYTVQVPVLPAEFMDRDNAKPVSVKVVSEQARVLLIAGGPMWEYRLVQGLLTRDKTIDLSCWLQSMDIDMPQEGDTPIVKLPHTPEELFKYDLIMMFDPDPAEFNEAWFESLKKFLGEHAGGFLYMAGPKYASRLVVDTRARALRDVLPIRLGDAGAMEIETLTSKNSKEWPLGLVQANIDHPVMRFDTDPQINLARWERMPGIFWSFPASTAKPAARTLLEHSDPNLRRTEGARPLLVSGQYGAGRTLFMGFNGTWRWRQLGKDAEYFNKYWIQLVRYLVEGRLLEGKRRGVIDTGGDVFRIGDSITVTARLYDAVYQPLSEPKVTATLKAGDAADVQLELRQVLDHPGEYEASVAATQLGLNELAITLPGEKGAESVRIAKQFTVRLPEVEYEDTRLNKSLLVELANRSGGQYFEVDRLGDIPAAIPNRRETIVVPDKPAELWDTDRLLYLLVGLLALEWAVRKRFKLL